MLLWLKRHNLPVIATGYEADLNMSSLTVDVDDRREISLRIPPKTEYVSLARVLLAAAASMQPNARNDRIDDLRLAVSEAVTNAVEAESEGVKADPVQIDCTVGGQSVEIIVSDTGSGFDPQSVPELPDVESPERLDWESGMGLMLMRQLVDSTDIESGVDGTVVTLSIDMSARPGV